MNKKEIEQKWEKIAEETLLNRKIVAVRYMTAEEQEAHGWYSRGVVMLLDNGVFIYPSRDDEGNDAGALFVNGDKVASDVLPVID